MSKINGTVDDWVRTPPPQGSFCQRLGNVIYNPEEKSFLGRTAKRWGIMLTFYLVFYAVLAILFAVCMGGLFLSLDQSRPTHILEKSLIGANPGVTSRPVTDYVVMHIHVENSSNYQQYIQQLDEFYEAYKDTSPYSDNKICTKEDNYGYPYTPCIFVKVNRIFNWIPECYDASELPEDMPDDLKEYIQAQNQAEPKQVWISCEDEKNNDTTLEYPWGRGLSSVHYPFHSTDGYKSPFVAVKLTVPVNELVIIRCRAWARNIIYNKSLKEPSGYTRLQFFIKDTTAEETTEAET